MAESRKRPDEKPEQSGTAPSGTESAASQVLRGIRDSVKAELRDAAETASLKMHLARAEKEKKEREKKPVFLKGLSASFAVNTVLMGPVLWFYYEIPVYSVILNLVVIPLLPVAMGFWGWESSGFQNGQVVDV